MKNTISILLLSLLFCFACPTEITAQKRRKAVKKHIAKRHKVRKAKHISRIRYRNLPRRGKVVRKLGAGFVNIRFRGSNLFVHNGVWYRPTTRNRYIVIKAPIGVRVRRLPLVLAQPRIMVGTNVYYYYYGTYYQKAADTEEYVVVEPPIGAKVDALPEDYETVEVNGMVYYRLDGVYYEYVDNEGEAPYFLVTKAP